MALSQSHAKRACLSIWWRLCFATANSDKKTLLDSHFSSCLLQDCRLRPQRNREIKNEKNTCHQVKQLKEIKNRTSDNHRRRHNKPHSSIVSRPIILSPTLMTCSLDDEVPLARRSKMRISDAPRVPQLHGSYQTSTLYLIDLPWYENPTVLHGVCVVCPRFPIVQAIFTQDIKSRVGLYAMKKLGCNSDLLHF
jgi:hypothetical protein